ncbi:MAG: serine hydrolase [Bacteroidales bacterium]|nr:serine hydrolase [Bacteroidales bacterium]
MKNILLRIFIYFSGMLLLGAFIRFTPGESHQTGEYSFRIAKIDPPFLRSMEEEWVDSVFNSLTEEERIAQLFMIDVYPRHGESHFREIETLIHKYNIGGIILFQGAPAQTARLTNRLQRIARTPLLTAMDAEWGLNMRTDSTVKYPKQMMLGAIQDDRLLFDMGYHIAGQLKRMGIYVNFAPVADVNNNPGNPVINIRSFGEDRSDVAKKSILYMAGMQENNVLAVAKHFPGHGDTDTDSHVSLPVISHDRHRLDSIELFPFKQLINSGAGGIMMAHLNVPALDDQKNLPTSLSSHIVDSILKKEMHFMGIVFTDAMNMGAVSEHYRPSDANLKAIMAGIDMLLMPDEISKTISLIKREIRRGNISHEELCKRCKKILAAKYWAGLNNYEPVSLNNLTAELNSPEYFLHRQKLVEASLTLLENKNELIPLKRLDTLRVASVTIGGNSNNEFHETLEKYIPVKSYHLPYAAGENDIKEIMASLEGFNLIMVSIQGTDMRAGKKYGIPHFATDFVDSIVQTGNVILNLSANPYSLSYFRNLKRTSGLILSYEDNELTRSLSAQLIFGVIPAKGLLPVTASKEYPVRSGIMSGTVRRLKYSTPAEAGIDEDYLGKIDSIALNAIAMQSTPGCQILAARKGIVFYQKSFGYHTYHREKPVQNTDLYDLASITKIAATMPAVMKLKEQHLLDIDKKISAYLTYLDTTNKKDITIKDILLHQSRLKAWIPFYIKTLEPLYPGQNFASYRFSESYPIKISNNYYVNKHLKYIDNYYSDHFSDGFPVKVAEGLYMNKTLLDTIWSDIALSELNGNEGYRYSDLGFYVLYKIIEDLLNKRFEDYLDSAFYRTMGAWSLCFNPLNRFDKTTITPTENDLVFRRQLIHGYVHDMGAAMLGGVCGHAGLFSNANDLAKIMQMLLSGGEYGGIRYLDKETIEYFTRCPDCKNGNRRGLGFDKPEPDSTKNGPSSRLASLKSFGHTGFTGTMAWVDPEQELIYVFLSNRIYPEITNSRLVDYDVRTKIQDVIYAAIKDE